MSNKDNKLFVMSTRTISVSLRKENRSEYDLLPPEILEKIFGHLKPDDILACSQVCRRWQLLCAKSNPLLIPRVLGTIFTKLDRKSILRSRQVCKLWRIGIDKMTASDQLFIRGESFICLENKRIRKVIMGKHDMDNPFPSRAVRLMFIFNFNPWRPSEQFFPTEKQIIRTFGSHVKFLSIKILICSVDGTIFQTVARNVAWLLPHLPNIQGLTLYISYTFGDDVNIPVRNSNSVRNSIKELQKDCKIIRMASLKAFRLVAWNFASEETEWLYNEILKHAPNLELFDPDYYMGYNKYSLIFSHTFAWPFQLTVLKLAILGKKYNEFAKLLRKAKYPLKSVYLDVFEFNSEKHPKFALKMLFTIITTCKKTLRTLSLTFHAKSKYTPAPAEYLGRPNIFRRVALKSYCFAPDCLSYSEVSPSKILAPVAAVCDIEYNTVKLESLKLGGYMGSLNFLEEFKRLKRLILMEFNPREQSLFTCEHAFYNYLPSLEDLYTPSFSSFDIYSKEGESKVIEEKYLPMYL